ncbi:hypothetical protein CWB96_18790 [Pseudoalteromonas citrea]|uniref:diguanylate cyclase n=1 Tax=Pseudoalteromonas citrea TaxID=43655 RepID=A0A5S3XJS7_9GAMM|nr:GGDEF domain-containing protein [Pseudoalteromonas citrea]TMP40345.1 hypothetical protein CWB97_18895 [Pseudoalteromonas citrea]TMP54695.1 hypothetical protein CWB96_18790 [Pseudoalteromonas citrea]
MNIKFLSDLSLCCKKQPILINRYPKYAAFVFFTTALLISYFPFKYAFASQWGLSISVLLIIVVLVLNALKLMTSPLTILNGILIAVIIGGMLTFLSFSAPLAAGIWTPAFLVSLYLLFPFKVAWLVALFFWLILSYSTVAQLTFDIALRLSLSSCIVLMLTTIIVKIYNDAISTAEGLATTDVLTGALNRRTMLEVLHKEHERVTRYKQQCCLVMIDLDNFKTLNDTYGHASGDELLIQFVKLVHESIRQNDTLFRLGGDEFMLVLPCLNIADAYAFVARLQKLVPQVINYKSVELGMSFGVCEMQEGETLNELIHNADTALYQNKLARKANTLL